MDALLFLAPFRGVWVITRFMARVVLSWRFGRGWGRLLSRRPHSPPVSAPPLPGPCSVSAGQPPGGAAMRPRASPTCSPPPPRRGWSLGSRRRPSSSLAACPCVSAAAALQGTRGCFSWAGGPLQGHVWESGCVRGRGGSASLSCWHLSPVTRRWSAGRCGGLEIPSPGLMGSDRSLSGALGSRARALRSQSPDSPRGSCAALGSCGGGPHGAGGVLRGGAHGAGGVWMKVIFPRGFSLTSLLPVRLVVAL